MNLMNQPDESPMFLDSDGQWKLKPNKRLLTDKEIAKATGRFHSWDLDGLFKVRDAQEARTASIKDAEIERLKEAHKIEFQMLGENLTDKCQQKIERIKREIEEVIKSIPEEEACHIDELLETKSWQKFWKQEGIDGS